jgi:hypothetical protein
LISKALSAVDANSNTSAESQDLVRPEKSKMVNILLFLGVSALSVFIIYFGWCVVDIQNSLDLGELGLKWENLSSMKV